MNHLQRERKKPLACLGHCRCLVPGAGVAQPRARAARKRIAFKKLVLGTVLHAMHGPFCQRTDLRKTDIHAGENTHGMHAAARHWQRVPSTAIRCCPSRIGGSASRRIAMDMHVAMGV